MSISFDKAAPGTKDETTVWITPSHFADQGDLTRRMDLMEDALYSKIQREKQSLDARLSDAEVKLIELRKDITALRVQHTVGIALMVLLMIMLAVIR